MTPERMFADTNVFLRYLTNDIPAQADAVERLLHRAAGGEITLVMNSLVDVQAAGGVTLPQLPQLLDRPSPLL